MENKYAKAASSGLKKNNKVKMVMDEWKTGALKSSSGAPVSKYKQAVAIGLSEQRRYGKGK